MSAEIREFGIDRLARQCIETADKFGPEEVDRRVEHLPDEVKQKIIDRIREIIANG